MPYHRNRVPDQRVMICAMILSWLGAVFCPAQDAVWEEVEMGGKAYVTAKSLKEFYRFDSYSIGKGQVFLRSPDRVVRMRNGTKDLYINNTRFVLSHYVAASDGDLLISKLDLIKLVDPVLRPRYIRQSAPFQTIVLDAGHGGKDTGSKGAIGHEKIFALRLTILIKEELERRQFRVKMTRTGDDEISLTERVAFANRISDAIFVSLHFNNGPRSARGIETYALPPKGAESTLDGPQADDDIALRGNEQDGDNIALATAIHASMMHELKAIDRGVRRARWGVLTGINKPAVLIEGGYLSNPSDAGRIASHAYLKQLASAIADGIVNYRNALRR